VIVATVDRDDHCRLLGAAWRGARSCQYVVIDNNLRQVPLYLRANLLEKTEERRHVAVPKQAKSQASKTQGSPSQGSQGQGSEGKAAKRQARGGGRHRAARPPQADAAASASQKLDFAELNDHIGYFLRRLQVAVFSSFIRTLSPLDIRPAQYSVLVLIAANPGRSQSAIGQALNIERARLARMLHELERRQWIERRAARDDRRSHSLFLTDGGAKALLRIRALAARHEERMVELIGPERRQLLLDLLREFG
jgi:DNA-binding MarR family transcriptional regulator